MTETVAIAIITAAAALIASAMSAGLTSWITLRNTRRQGENQLLLAREERKEQRAVQHRSGRRDAYVSFLSEALEAGAAVRSARESGLSDDEFRSRCRAAEESLMRLVRMHALVTVEGPPAIYDSAAAVRSALQAELDLLPSARADPEIQSQLLKARNKRAHAVGAMAAEARAALGGDMDTSEGP